MQQFQQDFKIIKTGRYEYIHIKNTVPVTQEHITYKDPYNRSVKIDADINI